ncbi:MAG: hypothetical protein ACWGQW_02180, partial [bacterium]
ESKRWQALSNFLSKLDFNKPADLLVAQAGIKQHMAGMGGEPQPSPQQQLLAPTVLGKGIGQPMAPQAPDIEPNPYGTPQGAAEGLQPNPYRVPPGKSLMGLDTPGALSPQTEQLLDQALGTPGQEEPGFDYSFSEDEVYPEDVQTQAALQVLSQRHIEEMEPKTYATISEFNPEGEVDPALVIPVPGEPPVSIPIRSFQTNQQHLAGEIANDVNNENFDSATEKAMKLSGDPALVITTLIGKLMDAKLKKDKKKTGGKKLRDYSTAMLTGKDQSAYLQTKDDIHQLWKTQQLDLAAQNIFTFHEIDKLLNKTGQDSGASHIRAGYALARLNDKGRLSDQDFQMSTGMLSKIDEWVKEVKKVGNPDLHPRQLRQMRKLVKELIKTNTSRLKNFNHTLKQGASGAELFGEYRAYRSKLNELYGGLADELGLDLSTQHRVFSPAPAAATGEARPSKEKKLENDIDAFLEAEGG